MRYTKHHKTAEIAKLPRGMIAGSAAVLALVLAVLVGTGPQPSTRKSLPDFSMPKAVVLNTPAAGDAKPLRLVYRNSIVPGGVHSAAELAEVIKRDPIAAAHYAGFDVSKAHLVQVEQSRMAHVSYRIGNQIYWTKNKVRLALGEYLLSDGEHLIRARCGNRIADSAQGPVLINEPAPEVLETAFVSADDLIDQTVSMAALGGLPMLPVNTAGTAPAAAADASPNARNVNWDRFGMPALVSIPTLPGVTVVGGRTADPVAAIPVVTKPAAADPVVEPSQLSASPVALIPRSPSGTSDAGDAGNPLTSDNASNPGNPGNPTDAAPIDVKTPLPVSADPSAPFIEAPSFTPAQPIINVPRENVTVPEPGSAILAIMALAMLGLAAWLRRRHG